MANTVLVVLPVLPLLTLLLNAGLAATEMTPKLDENGQPVKDGQGRVLQQMSIQAPAMTEEDQYGYNMPDRYRCDSCKAVIFHLNAALQSRQPKSRRLQEWEYTELFDETCTMETFKGYGVGVVDGDNVLSGPGIKQKESLEPGMGAIQMTSDTWSKRLAENCRKFVYDKVGEEDLYNHFRKSEDLLEPAFCYETKECKVGEEIKPKPKPAEEPPKEPKKKQVKKDAPKKEKKADTKAKQDAKPPKSPEVKSDAKEESCAAAGPMDVSTYFSKLAKKHGFPGDEYTRERSTQDWEQLLLRMAGRIYETSAAKLNQLS